MNVVRFSPVALILIALGLFSQAELQAGASNKSGNPYGNGTFFQNSGTFNAGSITTNTSGGTTTIAYQGYIYQGNASGAWNPSSGNISGEFWGSQNFSGTNNSVQTNYPEMYNSNYFPVVVPIITNQINLVNDILLVTNSTVSIIGSNNNVPIYQTNSTISTVTTNSFYSNQIFTNYLLLSPVGSNSYNNAAAISGSFSGNTANQYPNQTFTAQGTVTQQQLGNQDAYIGTTNAIEGVQPKSVVSVTIPVTVQGVRVSDSYSTFALLSNSVPYSITAYSLTNISTLP